MTRLLQIRLAVAGVGVAVWGYGLSADDARMRVIGMGLLAASLLLRFAGRRGRRNDTPDDSTS